MNKRVSNPVPLGIRPSPPSAPPPHRDFLRDALIASQVAVAKANNETLISLCERDALWLLLIAQHDGETPQTMISKMIAIYASQIGLQDLAADCGLSPDGEPS